MQDERSNETVGAIGDVTGRTVAVTMMVDCRECGSGKETQVWIDERDSLSRAFS
jgi:hypothetical protein